MKICLIRHGETDWSAAGRLQGREDIPLNDNGVRQSRAVAQALTGGGWHAVIASPLRRAARTARIIADGLGIGDVTEDACFIERDYGAASGLTEKQREARYADRRYEGMEDWEALRSRAFAGLRRYAETYGDENIIIVSHGGVINAILATISNHGIGSGKTRLRIACMNGLDYRDGRFSIDYYNRSAAEGK